MAQLQISLFGKLYCAVDSIPLAGLESRRAQELLGYLALQRRPQHRETLAVALWGDRPDQQARKGLRQALWLLQAALETSAAGNSPPFLLAEGDVIGFHPCADLWIDASIVEVAYAQLQTLNGGALHEEQAAEIRRVVQLYQGDLLEGWYEDWCVAERERHQNMYLVMLEKLMEYYEAAGDYQAGLECGMQVLHYDRAREHTHRRQMRLYYLNGERTQALQQYELCVHALNDELGVAPSRSTRHLYEQIRTDLLADALGTDTDRANPDQPLLPASTISPIEDLLRIECELERLQKAVISVIDALSHPAVH
jgi:DNA-binding SARP family transcriptional activator